MAAKRPKTLRGGTSAKMCVGCPRPGERLRHVVGGRAARGQLKMEGAPHEEAMT